MRRIARLSLTAALVAALAAPAAPTLAEDTGPPGPARPIGLWTRLLAPFQALFGWASGTDEPPPAAPTGGDQHNGPSHDPDGLNGDPDHDPDGSTAGAGTESDNGPENDPDG